MSLYFLLGKSIVNVMQKIVIIGCGGAGKSTLSKGLGNLLSLPIYHLDCLYWKPDWIPIEHDEFIQIQEKIMTKEQWIVDGNYGKTFSPHDNVGPGYGLFCLNTLYPGIPDQIPLITLDRSLSLCIRQRGSQRYRR